MSYVNEVIDRVIRENPNEPEFHQAVKEVLLSLEPVVAEHEEQFRRDALLERLVNPERQVKFRVPWIDDKGQVRPPGQLNIPGHNKTHPGWLGCVLLLVEGRMNFIHLYSLT